MYQLTINERRKIKKRILFFFATILCITNTSFSQSGHSDVTIPGTGGVAGIEMTNQLTKNPKTVNTRLIVGTIEGDHTQFYSVDINGKISSQNSNHYLSDVYTFTDGNFDSGNRLKQIDIKENFEDHNLTDKVEAEVPSKFILSQNYPNPFNPSTTINFDLPIEGFVSLKIFNSSGKEVANLLNESKMSGSHSVNFDASNLSSGIYYYKLETNNFSKVMKMAFVK